MGRPGFDADILRPDDTPSPGLYACGNDATSIFEGTYPGSGTTLGPALVFGWRAAMHAAGRPGGGPDTPPKPEARANSAPR